LKTFRKADVTYSGRGFHVKVPDKKASKLNFKERAELAKKFSKYPIDPWVSRGYIRLMRLPYSLNGLVSRIVVPLGKTKAFNQKETIPGFLKQKIKL
jgi:DNA primase catalytic subunit